MAIYKKPGKELVYDLINEANPRDIPFSSSNCQIESFTTGTFVVGSRTYNTSARVRGLQNSGYTGLQTVYYNRISLTSLLNGIPFILESYSSANIHSALPILNERYGLALTQTDVVNANIPNPNVANATGNVSFQSAAGSSFLVPGISVTLAFRRGTPKLDAFVTTRNLDAYNHPVFDDTRLSAQMLTFGLDLTEYRNLLLVDGTGMPNFAALSQVLTASYGLPAWDAPINSNYVTDNSTADVAVANKSYSRVVVQTGISNEQITGVAYFHYMV